MQSRSRLAIPIVAIVTGAVGLVLVWWLTNPQFADPFWHKNARDILQLATPPALAFIGWAGQKLLSPPSIRSTHEQLTRAQQALARRGLEWWRGVPEPAWPGRLLRAGLRPLAVPWDMRHSGGHAVRDAPASTEIGDLAAWLRDGRNPRLVIRGPTGSGKSVFARRLMAELLKIRRKNDPVPVFLPLWSWDPTQQNLNDWMKYQIGLAYPELRDKASYGPTAIAGLVDQGLVLPILDGLDALPDPYRGRVGSDGELMSQTPLIVTGCTDSSFTLDDSVAIEPGQVPHEEADRFLREITGADVLAELLPRFVGGPGSAADDGLRKVLCLPRIIYLASIVYSGPEPSYDLITADPAATLYERVERFLLRNVIPALLPAEGDWCPAFPWYAAGAGRWLTRLARLDLRDPDAPLPASVPPRSASPDVPPRGLSLDDPGTSRIAWWNLHRGVPFLRANQAWLRASVAAMAAFGACSFFFSEQYAWSRYSLMTAGGYGLLVLVAGSLLGHADEDEDENEADEHAASVTTGTGSSRLATLRWMWRYYQTRWGRIFLVAVLGFCGCGVLIGLRESMEKGPAHTVIDGIWTGFWDGLVQGAVLLVLIYVIAGVPAAPRTVRASDFRHPGRDGIRAFTAAVLMGLMFGLLWGTASVLRKEAVDPKHLATWPTIAAGLITGTDFAAGAWFFRWSRRWFEVPPGTSPQSAARADLAGAVLRPLILGGTFMVSFGMSGAPLHFVPSYLMPWFVVGVAFGALETEWPLYAAAIFWLALVRRELPARLTRFLECCRAAGILRVIGQEYQVHDAGLLRWLRSSPAEPDDRLLSDPPALDTSVPVP